MGRAAGGAMTLHVSARATLGAFTLDLAFAGPADGITVLFGPSGAGKSATLGVIAGSIRPREGLVVLGDQVLTDTAARVFVPPERRRIGVVHQDARLFPHMPVRRNLLYGYARAKERPIAIDDVIEMLAIGPLLDRRVADLSGGERQRVALGRALLSQPALLLLDEPVSALDADRRAEVLGFIARLRRTFALPMVYVTHDADEARLLGDVLVRIDAGRVVAVGPPAQVLPPRALTGEVVCHEDGATIVRIGGETMRVPPIDVAPGNVVRLCW